MIKKIMVGLLIGWSISPLSYSKCHLPKDRDIIILSGPVSHYLFALGLLNDPSIKAISTFHGFSEEDFQGEFMSGGIFISPKFIKKYKKPIVFFDQSKELRKNFNKLKIKDLHEVVTVNKGPFKVYQEMEQLLAPFLNGCDKQKKQLENEVAKIKQKVNQSPKNRGTFLFYLGKYEYKKRAPNLIMVDGFVLPLVKQEIIKSYPSDLNFIPWSAKIVGELEEQGKLIHVGLDLDNSKKPNSYSFRFSEKGNILTAIGSTTLIPGIPQIHFLKEFTLFLNGLKI